MLDKKCYIKKENVMIPKALEKTEKQDIQDLMNNEPDIYPKSNFLFKIWQMEYIEKGLREY